MGRVNRRIYATRRKRSPNKLWGSAMDHLNLTKKITGSTSEGGTARTTPFSIGTFGGGEKTAPEVEKDLSHVNPGIFGSVGSAKSASRSKAAKAGGAIAGAIQPVKAKTSTPTYLSDSVDSGSDNLAGNLTATVTIAKG